MSTAHVSCTSAAFSFIAAEIKKTEEQVYKITGTSGSSPLFAICLIVSP